MVRHCAAQRYFCPRDQYALAKRLGIVVEQGTSGSGVCHMRGLGFQYFSSKVSCDMAIAGLIVCKLENPHRDPSAALSLQKCPDLPGSAEST